MFILFEREKEIKCCRPLILPRCPHSQEWVGPKVGARRSFLGLPCRWQKPGYLLEPLPGTLMWDTGTFFCYKKCPSASCLYINMYPWYLFYLNPFPDPCSSVASLDCVSKFLPCNCVIILETSFACLSCWAVISFCPHSTLRFMGKYVEWKTVFT